MLQQPRKMNFIIFVSNKWYRNLSVMIRERLYGKSYDKCGKNDEYDVEIVTYSFWPLIGLSGYHCMH